MNDWRDNSEAHFHIMRDHPTHEFPIVSSLFGYRKMASSEDSSRGSVTSFAKDSYEKIMMGSVQAHKVHGPADLANLLLEAVIWPKAS